MLGPIAKGVGFAVSPAGRKAIRGAVRLARTEEGRKVLAQARKVATSPEGRKLIDQAMRAATKAGKAAATPENKARIRTAARVVRERKR